MKPQDLLAQEALAQIPKLLTLLDRNPHSPTYGCFDRNFWHYKIIDFPSGMAQEFVLPLALAYDTDWNGNGFYQQPNLKAWVEAGILYAAQSSHKDGSCDDYFPFERAGGAAAFSLLACVESYRLLGLENQIALDFFEKRSHWLAHHHESGRLTNHQALIALCLERVANVLENKQWEKAIVERIDRVLAWQHPEGWFQEYEGCDPGYQTLTISCLAQLYLLRPDPRLKEAIEKAVYLVDQLVHPDGSYGGEYTSRNTYNFFPHGFELVGSWWPEALKINDRFLGGLQKGLAPCYADDHIIGHHTWNYLLAWRDFVADRPGIVPRQEGRFYLPEAGILIDRRGDCELYVALNKGGVFKLFRQNQLIYSDTHFSLQVQEGSRLKNAVGHLVGKYEIQHTENTIAIQGNLGWAKQKQMNPLNLMILRIVMLGIGRFFPNLIRKILQKMLIVGRKPTPFTFHRQFIWDAQAGEKGKWNIQDDLKVPTWEAIRSIGIGCDQTSIYVVMSRTFQVGQLQPWLDLTEKLKTLRPGQMLSLNRRL